MTTLQAAPRPAVETKGGIGHGTGFWIAAAAFLVVMAYSTVPTPLWSLYQRRDGFSTFAVTVAFAAYAVGVVISLFLAGHLGDSLGRRRILLPAIGLEVVSAILFIVWPELPGLIVARVISGLGIGMLTATVTAHILDLHLKSRPGASPARGQIVSGAANLGGFGIGALISGVLARWVSGPLVTPYEVFLVLLILAFAGIALIPETATRPQVRPAYRPQRVRVPRDARARFFLAGGTAFAAFSVLGLFTSLAPVFVSGQLHITSRATAGFVVFLTFAAAALSQIAVRSLSVRTQVILGTVLLVAGIATLATVVVSVGSIYFFVLGGIISGAGAGTLFKAALAVAATLAPAENRGEVLAGIFLIGYIGLTVPVVGIGVATLSVSLAAALVGFAVIIIAIALIAALPLIAALGRNAA
ncbi:MFS transporter [Winogradskya humida]|uniref:Multi-drug efflux transporter n=1 Tax=Winogradskya humida TaxID=113566 RepID=A0ABQ3ZG43_9ACTN|nr:MFS transporter [Actinoplanes humidus]GIE17483.1 putative multi-drug efflux transporter [Actinoplanes humidus]